MKGQVRGLQFAVCGGNQAVPNSARPTDSRLQPDSPHPDPLPQGARGLEFRGQQEILDAVTARGVRRRRLRTGAPLDHVGTYSRWSGGWRSAVTAGAAEHFAGKFRERWTGLRLVRRGRFSGGARPRSDSGCTAVLDIPGVGVLGLTSSLRRRFEHEKNAPLTLAVGRAGLRL